MKSTSKVARPKGYRKVLTFEAYKTSKSKDFGYLTAILYMSPGEESGVINMCPMASPECLELCLRKSGRMGMSGSQKARIWRTLLFVNDPALFYACVQYDLDILRRMAARLGLIPVFRANGTSDFPKIAETIASMNPDLDLYDYTKIPMPWTRTNEKYHLTFSYSGHNLAQCMDALRHGVNVAVVFDTKKGQDLPKSWQGYQVIDGDVHDLRFLDVQFGKTVIVGLRAKGVARKQVSAFIVPANSTQFVMAA